jgi:nitrate reductase gamma subunit
MSSVRRPTAAQVLEALGFLSGLGTLGLGLLGTLPEHPHFPIGREVFGNVPDAAVLVFYVGVAAFLWLTFHLFAQRAASWQQGGPDRRIGHWGARLSRLYDGLSMKTLMRDPRAGVMHSMIYFGFIVLFLGTVTLEIDHLMPANLKFLQGTFYLGYSAILDLAGIVFLGGLALAVLGRYVAPSWRIRSKTKPQDALILSVLALIGITGLLIEGARISLAGRPDFELWSFVGYPLSFLFDPVDAADWHLFLWVTHVVLFVSFLVILPVTKLRHMVTSPADLFLSARDRPKGAMRAMPNLMEAEDIEANRGERCHRPHLEADLRHRRLHRMRPLHVGLSGEHHRQAPRPSGDGAQVRGGGGITSRSGRTGLEHGGSRGRRVPVRSDQARRGVRLHDLQGMRRDLSCRHRDPRPDPRHAPLSDPHGVGVPD